MAVVGGKTPGSPFSLFFREAENVLYILEVSDTRDRWMFRSRDNGRNMAERSSRQEESIIVQRANDRGL